MYIHKLCFQNVGIWKTAAHNYPLQAYLCEIEDIVVKIYAQLCKLDNLGEIIAEENNFACKICSTCFCKGIKNGFVLKSNDQFLKNIGQNINLNG